MKDKQRFLDAYVLGKISESTLIETQKLVQTTSSHECVSEEEVHSVVERLKDAGAIKVSKSRDVIQIKDSMATFRSMDNKTTDEGEIE